MGLRRRPLAVAITAGVALLVVLAVSARASAAGTAAGGPCPASWFPLPAQPPAIQQQCIQLRLQRQQDDLATARVRPKSSAPPPTPDPRFSSGPSVLAGYIPDDVQGIRAIGLDIFWGDNAHPNPITSVWQAGVVVSPDHRGYGQVIVYAVGSSASQLNPSIVRQLNLFGEVQPSSIQYNSAWICPRPLGALTITAITGPTGVVSFSSTASVGGSLDMTTGAWTFSQ